MLFGSHATGRATAAGDTDVLVVNSEPPREDAVALVKEIRPLRGFEPHVYPTSEAEQMASVISRMREESLPIDAADRDEA